MPFPLLALAAIVGVGAAAVAASSSSSARPVPDRFTLNLSGLGKTWKFERVLPPPAEFPLSPHGDPFVLSKGPPQIFDLANYVGNVPPQFDPISTGWALDATGQAWAPSATNEKAKGFVGGGAFATASSAGTANQWRYGWTPALLNADETWGEVFSEFVVNKVVPFMIAAAGAAIGGVGGLAVATALTAITKIAKGQKLTAAVIDAAGQVSMAVVERTTWGQAYSRIVSDPMNRAAVSMLREQLTKKSSDPATQAQAAKAFDSALALAQAKRIQDLTVARVKEHLDGEDPPRWLDVCLAQAVPLEDWVYSLYGVAGRAQLDAIVRASIADVQEGRA